MSQLAGLGLVLFDLGSLVAVPLMAQWWIYECMPNMTVAVALAVAYSCCELCKKCF